MVTFWSLCFLALAASSVSSGHVEASAPPDRRHGTTGSPQPWNQSPPSTIEALSLTPPPHSAQKQASERNDEPPAGSTTQKQTMETNSTAVSKEEADDADGTSTVTMATGSTSKPVVEAKRHVTWGYVILVLILLVIAVLSITLYSLRRASRAYSFDLQRAFPVSHPSEPTGTFEPVHLDLLDRPAPIDQLIADDLSPPPVGNGNALQSEEKDSAGENDQQPSPDGLETTPTSKANPLQGGEPGYETRPQ